MARVSRDLAGLTELIPLLAASPQGLAVDRAASVTRQRSGASMTDATSPETAHFIGSRCRAGPPHRAGHQRGDGLPNGGSASQGRTSFTPRDVPAGSAGEMEMRPGRPTTGAPGISAFRPPGIHEMLFAGREREFLGPVALPGDERDPESDHDADIDGSPHLLASGGWRRSGPASTRSCAGGPRNQGSRQDAGLNSAVLARAGGAPFTDGHLPGSVGKAARAYRRRPHVT